MGRVGEGAVERQARRVVGLDAGYALEDGVDVLDGACEGAEAGEGFVVGGLQDAVEPAEQDERQDDLLAFGTLVVARQQVAMGQMRPAWLSGAEWLAALASAMLGAPSA